MNGNEPPDGGGTSYVPMEGVVITSSQNLDVHADKRKCAEDNTNSLSKRDTRIPASASIQHTYTVPEFAPGTKLNYGANDTGPFIVQVVKTDDSAPGSPFRILKFAQLMHKYSVKGVTKGGIHSTGRSRVTVQFEKADDANQFLSHSFFTENLQYSGAIPMYSVTRSGLVRNIPTDWSLEELVNSIECPNHAKVIKARRLNRKSVIDGVTSWVPTQTVALTFLGQRLPEKVFCFYTSLPVDLYRLPTIQCNKCCRFGHIKANCRSNARCFKCSQPHEGESCQVKDENGSCLFCSGPHFATNPSCPEHARQKSIKLVMSEESISYSEAARRFRAVRRTFADSSRSTVSASPAPNPQSFTPVPSQSQQPQSTSYRKTVFIPRRQAPVLDKGYDKAAHNDITSSPQSAQPNGCCLNPGLSSDDNLMRILISALMNFFSRFSDTLPNNVMDMLHQLMSIVDSFNGSFSHSMEL